MDDNNKNTSLDGIPLGQLAQLTRDQSSDNFAELVDQFRKLVEAEYRPVLPNTQPIERYQAIHQTLVGIAKDTEHPLQDYARLELLISRFKNALNWESDDIRLPPNARQRNAQLVNAIEHTAQRLGIEAPAIERDYPAIRREFLEELQGEDLPGRVYVPYAYEGTRAARGEVALSPLAVRKFIGDGLLFRKLRCSSNS